MRGVVAKLIVFCLLSTCCLNAKGVEVVDDPLMRPALWRLNQSIKKREEMIKTSSQDLNEVKNILEPLATSDVRDFVQEAARHWKADLQVEVLNKLVKLVQVDTTQRLSLQLRSLKHIKNSVLISRFVEEIYDRSLVDRNQVLGNHLRICFFAPASVIQVLITSNVYAKLSGAPLRVISPMAQSKKRRSQSF